MKKLILFTTLLGLLIAETHAAFIVRQVRTGAADQFNNATEVRALWDQYPATRFGVTDVPFGPITVGATGENYNINVSGTVFADTINHGGNLDNGNNNLPLGTGTGGSDFSIHAYGLLDLPAGSPKSETEG